MANRNGSDGKVNLKIEAQLKQENNSPVKSNTTNNQNSANTIKTAVVTNTSIRVESRTPPLVSTAIGLSSLSESECRDINFGYRPSHQYARNSNPGFSAPFPSQQPQIPCRATRLRACLVYVDDNGVIIPPRTARILQTHPYLGYHQFYSSHQASAPYQPQYSAYMSAPHPNLVSSLLLIKGESHNMLNLFSNIIKVPQSNNIHWYSNRQSTSSFNPTSTSTTPQGGLNLSDYTFGGVNGVRLVEPQSINAPRSSHQSLLVPPVSSSSTSASHQNNTHSHSTTQTTGNLMNNNEATASTSSGKRGANHSPNHQRAPKSRFSLAQLAVLKEHFKSSPYLKLSDREVLAQSLDLTTNQVTHWFMNQRQKLNIRKRKAYSNSEHV